MTENQIAKHVLDAAFRVHSRLGPGLLEATYEATLTYELQKMGLSVRRQVGLPLIYDEVRLDVGYRLDLLVEDKLIVELKCVEGLAQVHFKTVMTYLRLSGHRLALLINFNEEHLKDGIRRVANGMP